MRAGMVDEPAHYRRSSHHGNALGQADPLFTLHALYLSLDAQQDRREASYGVLFAYEIDVEQITDIRMALQQSQPLGNSRFADTIEPVTGERREGRLSGRPQRVADGFQAEML